MTHALIRSAMAAAAAVLLLNACMGDGGSGGSGGSGQLTLSVTDAPVAHAEAVVVSFTGVTVKPASGQPVEFQFEDIRQIDLLALSGSLHEVLLDAETVPAGRYEWIRLHVISDDNTYSYILIDDDPRPLRVPSGDQTGLKLVSGFTVPQDGHAAYTIDFDLMKAVTCPPGLMGTCLLRPALRLVETELSGAIAGSIHPDVIAAQWREDMSCAGAVYIYDGDVTVPTDVGGPEDRAPVTTTQVTFVEEGDQAGYGLYEVGFLPAGFYLPVFTCDADLDDPELHDNETETVVRLLEGDVVQVVAGQTAIYDFQ